MSLLADLRYALRQLRKSPAFACTAIVTLGLCGLAASHLPARRAADTDPIEALRSE